MASSGGRALRCVVSALILGSLAAACGGSGGGPAAAGGDGAGAGGHDVPSLADGAPASSDTARPGTDPDAACVPACAGRECGPDSCAGSCGECAAGTACSPDGRCLSVTCGGAPTTTDGPFRTGVSDVSFDRATVALVHKRDVDAEEDGCIAAIDLSLAAGDGCRLRLKAGGRYLPDGGLAVTEILFTADSFCPGFLDADEGAYRDTGGLSTARLLPGVGEIPDENVAESCVATTLTLWLAGTLHRDGDGEPLPVNDTTIVVTGDFDSTGDIEAACPCRPQCGGRACGGDGCGGSCGTCPAGQACDATAGTCECARDCAGRECGPDPRCGASCGTCPAGEACSPNGRCDCAPDCGGRECGPDPRCGTSCGDCPAGTACDASGRCDCDPDCGDRECGPDPRCGASCGDCAEGYACDEGAGTCGCVPDCAAAECGLDPRCGRTCGNCQVGWQCQAGVCECQPSCGGRSCGPDPRCGESCGTCDEPAVCQNGDCVCTPQCGARECGPDPVCGRSCGSCTAPSECVDGVCRCTPGALACLGSWTLFRCTEEGLPETISCASGPSCMCTAGDRLRCASQTYFCSSAAGPWCTNDRCGFDFPN